MIGTGDGLPSDVLSEKAFLSVLMKKPDAIADYEGRISPKHFYRYSYREIYREMCKMYGEGKPFDIITLAGSFNASGELEKIGGLGELYDVQAYEGQYIPAINNDELMHFLDDYANNIEREYKKREGFKLFWTAAMQAKEDEDIEKLAEGIYKQVEAIATERNDDPVTAAQAAMEWLEKTEEARQNKGGGGIESGFSNIDAMTHGWRPGNFIVLAARPNMGKTALAGNFLVNAARKGIKVCIFSLEMMQDEIMDRLISATSGVTLNKILEPYLQTEEEEERAFNANLKLSKLPFRIEDFTKGGRPTVSNMLAKARRMQRREGLDLVIIDHLHIIASEGRKENRVQELASITSNLKRMAKTLKVPLICLAQLSRAVEGRNDKRPMLSDLRDSGTIEQDADIVMFLYRDDYYNDGKKDNIAELNIAKGRNVKHGKAMLYFAGEYMKFSPLARQDFGGMAAGEATKGDIPL